MKFSESWLRDWVDPQVPVDQLAHQLTMAGLEVDAVETVAPAFSGVVIGEIVAAEPHPDADKLQVCQVNAGTGENFTVVCGAPNARVGLKAPFAQIGAELPGDFRIKRAKLRGVESHGMLCAREELGVEGDSSGLWELAADAPVGAELRDWLRLDDHVIEVDLTPNRGDCLSLRGVAREVGVLFRKPVESPFVPSIPATIDDEIQVHLDAPEACARYAGRVVRDIDTSAATPEWMRTRLERAGLRSIDPIVDVTNYVLLELGQPLHAFDLDRLQGDIHVRMAQAGERLTLLNEQTVELDADMLLIADQSGPLAIGGIMGGESSAVTDQTRNIFLESAWFNPLAIAGRGRRLGLHTDASHRFERGVDPELQRLAIERATELVLEIAGGKAGPVIEVSDAGMLPHRAPMELSLANLESVVGCRFEADEVTEILERLGLRIDNRTDRGWTVTPPSWRFDLEIEADLVEEVIRIRGYDALPERSLTGTFALPARAESKLSTAEVADLLVSRDFREVITYSFVDPALQRQLSPGQKAVDVRNPIASDLSQMRLSMRPGLLGALRRNLNRQKERVRLFEIGQCFTPAADGSVTQKNWLGLAISGSALEEQWGAVDRQADFYDLKGDVEVLLQRVDGDVQFAADEIDGYHPGQCARIEVDGQIVGTMGALHPAVQRDLELPSGIFLAELELSALLKTRVPSYRELSRFPAMRRDLAVIVDRQLPVSRLRDAVAGAAGEQLHKIRIFDIYQGQGIEKSEKSVALGLTFLDSSRTLVESEVNAAIDAVVTRLRNEFDARLR